MTIPSDEPQGVDGGWVAAAPFRAKLHWLSGQTGLRFDEIALLTGIPVGTARTLYRPRRRLSRHRIRCCDAQALAACSPESLLSLAGEATSSTLFARLALQLVDHWGPVAAGDLLGLCTAELRTLCRTGSCSRGLAARLVLLTHPFPDQVGRIGPSVGLVDEVTPLADEPEQAA